MLLVSVSGSSTVKLAPMRRGGSSLAKIVARDHMRIARQELGLLPGGQVLGPTVMPSVNLDPDGVLQGFFITLATDARHTEMYYALDQGEWTRYEPLQVIHLEHSQNSASTPSLPTALLQGNLPMHSEIALGDGDCKVMRD